MSVLLASLGFAFAFEHSLVYYGNDNQDCPCQDGLVDGRYAGEAETGS